MISMMVEAVALSLDITPDSLYDISLNELIDLYMETNNV